jgi:hypothetical protein
MSNCVIRYILLHSTGAHVDSRSQFYLGSEVVFPEKWKFPKRCQVKYRFLKKGKAIPVTGRGGP